MIHFKTKHHADVSFFDDVALHLIRLMGHTETVPSALTEPELEPAIKHLTQAINTPNAQSGDDWDNDSVSLSHRASPLLALLNNAHQHGEHVFWEQSLR